MHVVGLCSLEQDILYHLSARQGAFQQAVLKNGRESDQRDLYIKSGQ